MRQTVLIQLRILVSKLFKKCSVLLMESFPVTEKLAFLFLISQKRVLYFNRKISQKSFTFQVNWEKKERERWYFLCYLTLFLTFDKKSCLGW